MPPGDTAAGGESDEQPDAARGVVEQVGSSKALKVAVDVLPSWLVLVMALPSAS